MAIAKKIRFEVFKRDGFSCQYCGKTPPAVTLEIDHIEPKANGGNDDILNLITACFDCNRGKRDIPLDRIPNSLIDNLEVLKEQETQIKEYRKFIKKIAARKDSDITEVSDIFRFHFVEYSLNDGFKNRSLSLFLSKLPLHEVIDAMNMAISKRPTDPKLAVKYFCGVCWRKIKGEFPWCQR